LTLKDIVAVCGLLSEFYWKKRLFASGLLCSSIFTFALIGRPTIQCVALFRNITRHVMI